jgi:hypothetical protein
VQNRVKDNGGGSGVRFQWDPLTSAAQARPQVYGIPGCCACRRCHLHREQLLRLGLWWWPHPPHEPDAGHPVPPRLPL